jgi:hypothetical protein
MGKEAHLRQSAEGESRSVRYVCGTEGKMLDNAELERAADLLVAHLAPHEALRLIANAGARAAERSAAAWGALLERDRSAEVSTPAPKEIAPRDRRQSNGKHRRGTPAMIEHGGEKLTARQWAERLKLPGVDGFAIARRIRRGWSVSDALSKPLARATPKARAKRKARPAPARNGAAESPPPSEPEPAPQPRASESEDKTLMLGRVAMAAAATTAGLELSNEHRFLLERPEAQAITPRLRRVAEMVLLDAGELVPDVLAGTISLKRARARAGSRRQYRETYSVETPPEPVTPSAPSRPRPIFTAHDLIEHEGMKRSIAEWATSRGDTTPAPLLAQLRVGMTMAEAMRHAPH